MRAGSHEWQMQVQTQENVCELPQRKCERKC